MCKQLKGALLQIVSHTDLLDQTEILVIKFLSKETEGDNLVQSNWDGKDAKP